MLFDGHRHLDGVEQPVAPEAPKHLAFDKPLVRRSVGTCSSPEIAAIRGEDVDWERGQLWVASAKGGRPVWRPMHTLTHEHLAAQGYPREGFRFPSTTGEHVTGRSVSDTISKAMKRAGIAHRPHDLRKWHGTTLIALGADSLDVQHSLRHVDGQSMKA